MPCKVVAKNTDRGRGFQACDIDGDQLDPFLRAGCDQGIDGFCILGLHERAVEEQHRLVLRGVDWDAFDKRGWTGKIESRLRQFLYGVQTRVA